MPNDYYNELVSVLKKKKLNKNQLNRLKIKLCYKYKIKKIPTDIEVLLNANKKDIPKIKKYLLTKPTRTISGVAVCAIMTKPISCKHGKCIYCPGGPDSVFGNIPQSYTGKEPATRRAIRNKFDPYLQVFNRLEQYIVSGHVPDKIELIIMGGTFPSFSKQYQEYFIKYALKAMNDFSGLFFRKEFDIVKFKKFFELPGDITNKKRTKRIHKKLLDIKKKTTLLEEQLRNESSNIRCVALVIETRPDYGKLKHGNGILRLGTTRVEVGIQIIDDKILKKIERGHSVKDIIDSTRQLKDLGFKISYHVMPGLPGVSLEKDLNSFKELFRNSDFRPDMLKIYPCMVLKGTKLYNLYKKGKYKPLDMKKAIDLIIKFKKYMPRYCRVSRVQRDIPTFMTEAGVEKTNIRQYIEKIMTEKKIKCHCIRCREPKNTKISNKIKIIVNKYKASKGTEFFISVEDTKNDVILGLCRLRFPLQELRKEITKNSALIRELHVFGPSVSLGKKGFIQHKGLGKKLLKKAENIAKKHNKDKIVVISGIGARDYYHKLNYKKQGPYMVRNI